MVKEKRYDISCPSCKANLLISVTREKISDPIPGEYKETVEVVKSSQTRLDGVEADA